MAKVNPDQIIGDSKFNRLHLSLFLWSFFIILFDGYDLAVYGTALPLIMEDWGLNAVEAGSIASYGLFGMVFGAIIFGILADRIGRKKVIIINVLLFSLFTLLCGLASSAVTFSIYRFIAGLGLGGIMPNIAALVSDYAPKKMKIKLVSYTLVSFAIGGALAPTVGVLLIEGFGWRSVFMVAGLPLLAIPFMMKQLPESSKYLIRTGKKEELFSTLAKVSPGSTFKITDEIEEVKATQTKVPVAGLFKEHRAFSTIGFWIAFFCALLMVYGLNTWLPKLMIETGYGLNSSLGFLIALQGGAIIGILALSSLCEEYGSKKVIMASYISGAIALALLGFGGSTFYIFILVAIAGAATTGAQVLIQAYVTSFYPSEMKSTGLGVASGIGRFGGMTGPILGGFLLTLALPNFMNFLVFSIVSIVAAIGLLLIADKYSASNIKARATTQNTSLSSKGEIREKGIG
ncbi:MFS transporter [Thalassobacillus devorans]|uniref:MFS transporter n=1 Tax=Thalassobacillus devorans TaxID=279813 RepID=A0ABQ1PJ01_9BACI|nr:MFS transporter [Thalassobacillus devorans]NIK30039.1 AAHS family benzoate transporter-like MFS transporter [Thalassobacillus devorans]GGC97849.1 MFS transporter [Thalassobacillus devorans]